MDEPKELKIKDDSSVHLKKTRKHQPSQKIDIMAVRDLKSFQREKQKLQNLWRRTIFKRDGYRCVACGCDKKQDLHLHHLTKVDDFISEGSFFGLHWGESLLLSYEPNNLTTACKICHKVRHMPGSSHRANATRDCFNALIRQRGWNTAADFFILSGFKVVKQKQVQPPPETPHIEEKVEMGIFIHPWCGREYEVEKEYVDNEYEYAFWCEDCPDAETCKFLVEHNFDLSKPIKPHYESND